MKKNFILIGLKFSIICNLFFRQMKNWIFPSFWIVLHIRTRIVDYRIGTQNKYNLKLGFIFPSFKVVLHIGIGTKGYLKPKVMELVPRIQFETIF